MKPSLSIYSNAGGRPIPHPAAKLTAPDTLAAGHLSKILVLTAVNNSACEPCSSTSRAAHRNRKTFYLFAALQLADFTTTMAAIHFGGFEANPMLAYFLLLLGPVTALLAAKLLLIAIACGAIRINRPRAVRLANVFYAGIVFWNLQIIVRLIGRIA